MNIRCKVGRTKAFTLVEIIIAVAIIGVSAAGLMGCFTGSFFIMRMARENQRATQILVERAEALRLFSWTDITNGNLPLVQSNIYYDQSGYNNQGTQYTVTLSTNSPSFIAPGVTAVPAYNNNLIEINIAVNWTTDGIARTRNMNTLVAYDGVQNYVY